MVFFVILGTMPIFASFYQFILAGFHQFSDHYNRVENYYPRVAVVVPAWNEGAVIGATIDRLMKMEYPEDRLRVYVVDDASTDDTPDVIQQKAKEYSGRTFHIRREKGGQGKAHTLNHGIQQLLHSEPETTLNNTPEEVFNSPLEPDTETFTRPNFEQIGRYMPNWAHLDELAQVTGDQWVEALMIIDADVIFERDALRKMARHLSDPEIGAVTAYIKEGSSPGNYMQKFIGYEYITAQAASRRAQNVLGAMFCLAGGAQLHSRENLELIGGRIDTSSLAEDTFTTFKTQIEAGKKVVFEGNAIVWAEEPDDVNGLWKQRLRWARGNVQLTKHFKHLWFNKTYHRKLGGFAFGFIWFNIFLMPVLMILSSIGLVSLYFMDFPFAWEVFRAFWLFHAINYLFVTLMSFAIDPFTAKRTWLEGFLFPGIISFSVIVYSCFPGQFVRQVTEWLVGSGLFPPDWVVQGIILFIYAWQALCMVAAWGVRAIDKTRFKWLSPMLMYFVGFGPMLCAITFHSYILEAQGAEMKWDKTIKTGKVKS
ncbi:MAG: glycosyltransferase family 2 protein [Bacteroidetes Order II. Incertae sedis bacterium]|nr:glycosyltransferase family 2 protein [Bacteroidetes Order II. bacterium]